MKLLISIFLLLAGVTIFGTQNSANMENFYKEYHQPKDAKGSPDDFKKFWETGECRYCNLEKFDLREAVEKLNKEQKKIDLRHSNLGLVDLREANLTGANLQEIDARLADMQKVNMSNANIKDAKFRNAKLKKAILYGAIVNEGTSFHSAECHSIDLRGISNLDEVDFTEAKLHDCKIDFLLRVRIFFKWLGL